jgi:hypothetical protein
MYSVWGRYSRTLRPAGGKLLRERYFVSPLLFRLNLIPVSGFIRPLALPEKSTTFFHLFFIFSVSFFFFFFDTQNWTSCQQQPVISPSRSHRLYFTVAIMRGLFAWQFKIWHDEHQRSLDVDNTISMEGFTPKAIKASCPGRYHGKSFYCDKRKKKVQSHRKYCERDRFGRKSVVRFQTWFDPNTTVSISRAGDWNTQGITVQLSMYLRTTREKGALSRFEKNNI